MNDTQKYKAFIFMLNLSWIIFIIISVSSLFKCLASYSIIIRMIFLILYIIIASQYAYMYVFIFIFIKLNGCGNNTEKSTRKTTLNILISVILTVIVWTVAIPIIIGIRKELEINMILEQAKQNQNSGCNNCELLLKSIGINDQRSYRDWALKNHPDKLVVVTPEKVDFYRVVSDCYQKWFGSRKIDRICNKN
jgi:hypothetical protein